jgi:putative glycosyltransferase (TIGR04348 family)
MRASRTKVVIISPALRGANNGNWRTAQRWSRFLRRRFDAAVCAEWSIRSPPAVLIALHARRSAVAIEAFAQAYPERARVLVLTGTDLYRDIASDAPAQHSLDLATHLVVLQEAALEVLDPQYRRKCRVIYQSAPPLEPGVPRRRTFDVVLVGHMRAEKDPLTPMRALERLPVDSRVRIIHIGEALSDEYARAASALQNRAWPSVQRYRWLGGRPHGETRRRIRDAGAMLVSSTIEGGANVIVEAVTCGVPVVASRIAGNIGMLSRDYAGYFTPGDDRELARLLERLSRDAPLLAQLRSQCERRAVLFDPSLEQVEVNRLVDDALAYRVHGSTTTSV